MHRNGLIVGVAAVLFGVAALMLVLGVVVNPIFLFAAVPFGATAYLMWYQASGRLAERVRRDPEAGRRGAARGFGPSADRGPGGFGAGPFDGGRFSRERADENRRRARTPDAQRFEGPSPQEAYRILGLDSTASADDVKRAYRRRVKEVHPDADAGDEEEFKRVRRAYDTLTD